MTLALLAVDLYNSLGLSGSRCHYQHGSVDLGFERVVKTLDLAREMGYPVYATTFQSGTLSDIIRKYVPKERIIDKSRTDAFKGTRLAKKLKRNEIDTLLIFGFHRDGCVIDTVNGALENGLSVITSEQLMFSTTYNNGRRRYTLTFFRENTLYLNSATGVIAYLKRQRTI